MVAHAWCRCPNSASCLWTDPSNSYTELKREPRSTAVKYEWRCSRCKGASSKYVGSLWKNTVLATGFAPACELGCPGGAPHAGGACGRTIPGSVEATFPCGIRVSLFKGPDFILVHSAHVSEVAYLSLAIKETHALHTPPVKFRVGVCIWPTISPGAVVPASHRTRLTIGGVDCREGKLPMTFCIDDEASVVMDRAPAVGGVVSGAFLSRSADFWKRLFSSPCALKRHGSLLHGHTHAGYGVPVDACGAASPAFPEPCPVVADAACRAGPDGGVQCAYCGAAFPGPAAYHRACAPELEIEEVCDLCSFARGEVAVPHGV